MASKKTMGEPAIITRSKKGSLVATRSKNYGGVSDATLATSRKLAAGSGTGSYSGNVAPMVGGKAVKGAGKKISYGNSSIISKKNQGKLKK